jgi:hypothetical protein
LNKHENRVINANQILNENDCVRRPRIKKGILDKTKYFDNWTEEVYTVAETILSDRPDIRNRYRIRNEDGRLMRTYYYREELLKIPNNNPQTMPINNND